MEEREYSLELEHQRLLEERRLLELEHERLLGETQAIELEHERLLGETQTIELEHERLLIQHKRLKTELKKNAIACAMSFLLMIASIIAVVVKYNDKAGSEFAPGEIQTYSIGYIDAD